MAKVFNILRERERDRDRERRKNDLLYIMRISI